MASLGCITIVCMFALGQVEYIRQGKLTNAEKVLTDATQDGTWSWFAQKTPGQTRIQTPGVCGCVVGACASDTFKSGRYVGLANERMVCFVTLGMLYLRLGSNAGDMNTAVQMHRACEECLTKADQIKHNFYLTTCGRGALCGVRSSGIVEVHTLCTGSVFCELFIDETRPTERLVTTFLAISMGYLVVLYLLLHCADSVVVLISCFAHCVMTLLVVPSHQSLVQGETRGPAKPWGTDPFSRYGH
jgi:hypothetical protein